MGLSFGVFGKLLGFLPSFRKKRTTIETLEHLDNEIKEYEKYKQKSESNEKKYIGALLLYSIMLYIVGAVFYYIYLMPKNISDRVMSLVPFFIMPFIIFFIRKFLKWYFIKRQTNCENMLIDLKEEKKNILEEVKEKETYKKAREILERFSSGVDIQVTPPSTPMKESSSSSTPFLTKRSDLLNETGLNTSVMNNAGLVHRNVKSIQNQSMMKQQPQVNLDSTSSLRQINNTVNVASSNNSQQVTQQSMGLSHARTVLPRPIIAPNRTVFDKVLDFFIGDGPNNRYALICKSCHFHNGMALKEEFEYVAFRCAYCLFYNDSRKTKLSVPSNKKTSDNGDMNESNASTSNDSGSFEEGPLSEPVSSSASNMQKAFKKNLEKSSSRSSLENIGNVLLQRKGSLTDSSNSLTKGGQSRRGSTISINKENKENIEGNFDDDFEHIQSSSKKLE